MNSALASLIVDLVELSVLAVVEGGRTARVFSDHAAAVRRMVEAGRDPDPAERAALQAEIGRLRAQLHAHGQGDRAGSA